MEAWCGWTVKLAVFTPPRRELRWMLGVRSCLLAACFSRQKRSREE